MSTQPNIRAFSYRDEEALVRHLVGDLERKLSGRHETRILRIIPSDHCHLGVLGPRDPHVVQPEPLDPDADVTAAPEESGTQPKRKTDAPAVVTPEEEEPGEVATTEAEQVTAEQQGTTRDSTRRPPSSLGFEVVIAPGEAIEITLQVRFAVYTQHFPTFEEERDELGRTEQDQAGPNPPAQQRQTVSLLEVFERRIVDVPPITVRLDPRRRTERLSDQGAVQRALDAVLADAAVSPTIARAIAGTAVVPAQALTDANSFHNFLRGIAMGAPTLPPLLASLDIRSSLLSDGTVRVSCYICNNTPRDLTHRFRDQHNILADCELSGTIVRGTLMPVELLPVAKDYQFDRRVWAVGHSASVVVSGDRTALRTETLARFDQPRRTTNQENAR